MTKRRPSRGFTRATSLLERRLQKVGEKRGFAIARLLTHWSDIVGPETARRATPVKISHDRGGLGATLTVLAQGATAPMVEMQTPAIRDRVNACYGYNAIARVRVTQTAATGFAEGQTAFTPARAPKPRAPTPETMAQAARAAADVQDTALRAALTDLGANLMTKLNHRSPS